MRGVHARLNRVESALAYRADHDARRYDGPVPDGERLAEATGDALAEMVVMVALGAARADDLALDLAEAYLDAFIDAAPTPGRRDRRGPDPAKMAAGAAALRAAVRDREGTER